jgi:hypothetical protein
MNNSSTHQCKNCGTVFTDTFCNHCGQKIHHRFTIGHVWHETIHAVTHADKGFPYLMMQLFKRPGIVAREYIIDGKRKKYFNPLTYALILGSIAAFVAVNSNYMVKTMSTIGSTNPQISASGMKKLNSLMGTFTKYYNLLHIIQIPFFAAVSRLLYRRKNLFYAEHLMLHCFQSAQATLIAIVSMLLYIVISTYLTFSTALVTIFYLVYYVWTITQFFNEQNLRGYLKATLSYLLGLLFYVLFFMILTIVGLIIYTSFTKN